MLALYLTAGRLSLLIDLLKCLADAVQKRTLRKSRNCSSSSPNLQPALQLTLPYP
ncbi:hypothetical protein CHS0354_005530, partial [Potamilus streckersoni]